MSYNSLTLHDPRRIRWPECTRRVVRQLFIELTWVYVPWQWSVRRAVSQRFEGAGFVSGVTTSVPSDILSITSLAALLLGHGLGGASQ